LDKVFSGYEQVIFHCFSYGEEILQEVIRRKGAVCFSLNILRSNAAILASLRECPLENMLLETDSPYMKIKDKHSTPLDIEKVYARAAEIKGIEPARLEAAVSENSQRLFSFS
jgi:TatD DNase family protein